MLASQTELPPRYGLPVLTFDGSAISPGFQACVQGAVPSSIWLISASATCL